jgi:hypothetical protein
LHVDFPPTTLDDDRLEAAATEPALERREVVIRVPLDWYRCNAKRLDGSLTKCLLRDPNRDAIVMLLNLRFGSHCSSDGDWLALFTGTDGPKSCDEQVGVGRGDAGAHATAGAGSLDGIGDAVPSAGAGFSSPEMSSISVLVLAEADRILLCIAMWVACSAARRSLAAASRSSSWECRAMDKRLAR